MKEEQPPPQPPTPGFADPQWPENVADFIALLTKYIKYRRTFVKKRSDHHQNRLFPKVWGSMGKKGGDVGQIEHLLLCAKALQ